MTNAREGVEKVEPSYTAGAKEMGAATMGKSTEGPYKTQKESYRMIQHGLPRWYEGKEPACQCRRHKTRGFDPCVGKIPWKGPWQPTPLFLPRKSHGHRSLVGYSPWGRKEADATEQLTLSYFHIGF